MSLHKEISFETETKGEPDSSPGYAGKLRCSVHINTKVRYSD